MFTLIQNADVYDPEPLDRQDVLLVGDKIGRLGKVDWRTLEATGLETTVIDGSDCVLTPGLIDPHEHLLGGSGEKGFSAQTPMVFLSEIVSAGITTVVGVLGVDTTMKTMAGLLAHVKGLRQEGISAYLWSGGYNVPPTSVTKGIRDDLMFIQDVIGAGEVAIADSRGLNPDLNELVKLVLDTHVGGLLSNKCGLTHFHVGEHDQRLKHLRELVEGDYAVTADMLYPTHVARSEALMDEAIALVSSGACADIDTVEGELAKWVTYWFDHGGDPERLPVSSDAGSASPSQLHAELRDAVIQHGLPLERMLPLVTRTTSRILKLDDKGRVAPGLDADIVLLGRDALDIVHVFARGTPMVRDGALTQREDFLADSHRRIELVGARA